ncbi:MAG: hypothetical protein PHV10_05230 [Sulfuricurvum sp.]|nr:hypothetical protein [Sulfuricurvum sp.]
MRFQAALAVALAVFVSGCSMRTPHESLNAALEKSFRAQGYDYTSSTRITKLSVSHDKTDETDRSAVYVDKGLSILRSLSLQAKGSVDIRQARSEALYDLRYAQNNVEVSVRVPLMADYENRVLYIGNSFLNTLFPMRPEDEKKLIRFDLNDTMMQSFFPEDAFNASAFRSMNRAIQEGTLKGFAEMNGSLAYYDAASGNIRVRLDHDDSVGWFVRFSDAAIVRLFQDGVLSKEEYGAYMILSDQKRISALFERFVLATDFEIALNRSGRVERVTVRLDISDAEGSFMAGIENTMSIEHYDDPHFTLDPEKAGTVHFHDVVKNFEMLMEPVNTLDKIFQEPADVNDALGVLPSALKTHRVL